MKTTVSCSASSLLTLIVALNLPLTGHAGVPGSVDHSFQSGLSTYGLPFTTEQLVKAVQRQADGKVLVGGELHHPDRTKPSHFYRLNANGSVDTAFNRGGAGVNGDVRAIIVLGDGKILIGGSFTSYNGVACNRIARLNANGSLDATLIRGAGALDGSINTIVRLSTGKFLVGGSFTGFGGRITAGLVRMHPDGSVDESFNPGGRGFDGAVNVIKLLRDGNLLVGGSFTGINGYRRERVAKMSAEGALIFHQFLTAPGANGIVRALLELPDGKVLIGGDFTSYMKSKRPYLTCVDATGFPVEMAELANFDAGVLNLVTQTDGRILVSGNFARVGSLMAPGLARLTSTGAKDSFQAPLSLPPGLAAMSLQPDGRILIGGLFDRLDSINSPFVARLENAIPRAGATFNGIATSSLMNNHLGGRLSFVLTNTGSFTGRYTSGTTNVSLTGTMSDSESPSWRGSIPRTGGEVLTFDLIRGRDTAGTEMIIGTVSSSTSVGAASIVTHLAHYDATYLRATHLSGLHTALLTQGRTPDAALPNGHSYMTQTIATAGTVAVTASLGDGTIVTASSTLNASDHCLLYMPFATNRASLCGQIEFLGHDLSENVTGNLRWRKPSTVATGADNGLEINDIYQVHGSDYQTTLGYGISPVSASTSAQFVLSGGHLGHVLTQGVSLRNNRSLAIGTSTSELRLTTLAATASTGAISGSCTVPMPDGRGGLANRTGTIRGVFVQGLNQGVGRVSIAGSTATNVRSSAFTIGVMGE